MENVGLNLLSSASAGFIARLICHPVDTMKSRLQSGSAEFKSLSFVDTVVRTMRVDGFRGFYRGLGAVLIGGIPATSLYLTSYEVWSTAFVLVTVFIIMDVTLAFGYLY